MDEVETDQFLQGEISQHLTMGQDALFNHFYSPNHMGEKPGVTAYYETSIKISEYLQPFLVDIEAPPPPRAAGSTIGSGVTIAVPDREIVSLVAPVGVMENGVFHPMGFATNSEALKRNTLPLFRADVCDPYYTISASSPKYRVYPADTYHFVRTQALLRPVPIDLAGGVGSDFHASLTTALVYQACIHAGISIREFDFVTSLQSKFKQIGV